MRARERAQAEWARLQPVAPTRDEVQAANDDSLEWLIYRVRRLSVWLALVELVWLEAAAITGNWHTWLAAGLHGAVTALAGWFGWWHYGNAEWRKRAADAGE